MIRLALGVLLLSCQCFAELPPVEGELGPPPSTPSARRWKFSPQDKDSDDRFLEWEAKFNSGSVRRLGSAKDATAISSLLPATKSRTLHWVSRSVVVVMSACPRASSMDRQYCLYVCEKHGSKWDLTHHYRVLQVPLRIAHHLTNR
jgi:hypothetical protein